MFKNNQFSKDTHEEHLQRCILCASGVVTHDPVLSFRPAWVADIATHATNFETLLNAQNIEDAEWHGAVASLEALRNSLYELNFSARWMVKTILDDPTMSAGDLALIDDAFDIDDELTKGFFSLTENTRKLLLGQEQLVAIGATWTLPLDMVTNLTNGFSEIKSLSESAEIEHGEKLKATKDLYSAREVGENLLRNLFRWVVANWGDDDTRMLEFGFVPKSQIWTPGQPEPGGQTFPEIFKDFKAYFQAEPSPMNVVGWLQYIDCDFARLFRVRTHIGASVPERPDEIWQDEVTDNPLADQNIKPGYIVYYWLCAVKNGEEGEFAMCSCKYPE